MSKPSGRLVLASVCCLLSASVGTWLAIRQHLSAQFGGLMHGEDVVKDFFWRGTALSAPFPLLLGQFVLTGCLVRRGRIGRVGVRGLTVLGGCYTLGQLGEPIVGRVFKVGAFEPAPALLVVTNMLLSPDDGVRHPGMERRKRVKPPKRSKNIASKSIMWG